MSWSDPARRFEPAEDVQLRAELRDLLGLGPAAASAPAAPSAELAALANDLRREALRRRRTERKRPTWGLLAAAALPLLAVLAGLGTWGFQQKHRADGLALQAQRQEQELTRMAAYPRQPKWPGNVRPRKKSSSNFSWPRSKGADARPNPTWSFPWRSL